ncbi:hypothetical protein Bbelb_216600 [Branchiostoma belcheri]|nr:hypothetical protein Bbelb_216600 [Branchiostoma belcheri]
MKFALGIVGAFMVATFSLAFSQIPPPLATTCPYPVDLVFLLDSSETFRTSGFEEAKTFVQNVVNYFTLGPDDTRVGVVTYSHIDEQVTRIKLNNNYTRVELLNEIRNIPYDRGGYALTGIGLDYVRNYSFHEQYGRRNNTLDFLIVITDDESWDDVSGPAQLVRDMGITVFVVGVGEESDIHTATLETIAGDPSRVFRLEDHDFLVDDSHPRTIREAICHAAVTSRRTCFCVLFTCKNAGKRRTSVRGEYHLRTESYGFGSTKTRPDSPPVRASTGDARAKYVPYGRRTCEIVRCKHVQLTYHLSNERCTKPLTARRGMQTALLHLAQPSTQCPTLTAPANGALSTTATSYLTVVTFTCNPGYVLTGAVTATCQADITWSNPVPTCTPVQCPDRAAPANGAVSPTGAVSYLTVVTFTCNTGYTLNGVATPTCQADGTWSNPVPTCQAVQCTALTAPANGAVSPTGAVSYPNSVTFTCNSGYTLSGATGSTCQADGTWSNPVHTCTAVQCPARAAPANGAVSPTGVVSYPNSVTFICKSGYTLNGAATPTCQADRSWSSPVPTCQAVQCPARAAPANGAVSPTGAVSFPNSVIFTCNSGYTLSGVATPTCQADGTWSNPVPTCQARPCPTLTAPTNGALRPLGPHAFPTVVTFACKAKVPITPVPVGDVAPAGPGRLYTGYARSGAADTTCRADGTWSNPVPTCRVGQCSTLTAPANGAISTTATSFNTVVTFTCNPGYVRNGATSTTCQEGTWSNPIHTCTPVQCPARAAPANGAVSPTGAVSYPNGVTFTCNTGYGLSGAATLTCQADGTWSHPQPTCQSGQCPTLTPPSNGTLSPVGATSYRDVVTFTCNQGYELVGTSTVTCLSNLAWSHAVPTCRPVLCSARAAPANGAVSPTGAVSYPNGVTFTCNPGYVLNGVATPMCQTDGTWSNPVPSCRDIDACLANPCVTEATCTDNPAPALDATCTCNTGYTGDGFINGTGCSASSSQCPALLAPTNGMLSPTGETSYQTVVTFTCNTGHLLDGASSATCQADGTWSNPVPTCRDINDCSPNLCKNGGVCTDLGNSFQCACAAGYEGDTCQTDINDCSPNPCQHGGTCTDLVNGFQCECLSGYSGDNCESDGTPFGVWALVGTAVGCLVAGVLLGVAAILLILRCRKTKSKTYDTAEDVYESVRTPGRAASQRSGTGSDAYYSYPMVPRPLPPPLPSQPRGHYQDLRPAVYQGLQKDRGDPGSNPSRTRYMSEHAPDVVPLGKALYTTFLTPPRCEWVPNFVVSQQIPPPLATTCPHPVDLVFLLDSSESFRTSGFEEAKTFVQNVVNYFTLGENDTRIGVVTYSNIDAQITRIKLNENYTRVELLTEIRDIPYDRGHTFTGLGLDHVRNYSFLEQYGRRSNTLDFLIVLTDDEAEDDIRLPAQLVRDMGITVFVVGVGEESDIHQATLETIAGDPRRVFRLEDHNFLVDDTHPRRIREAICDATQCPTLTAPANGALSTTATSYLTVVTFTCNPGYVLTGAVTATCQADITWSNPVPTCPPVQCPVRAAPANGAVSPTGANFYLTVVTFTCNIGYTLNGAAAATCRADGTWSNPVPTCQAVQCTALTAPANGAVSPTGAVSYPNSVTFTCNSGYTLTGATGSTCRADGTWSNPVHTCTAVQCPARAAPANGAVSPTGAVSYPNGVTFTCNSGYRLNGVATPTCQADGRWSHPVPTCTPRTCASRSAPANGAVSPTGAVSYPNSVTFTCNSGYVLSGAATATCQADGTWSHPVPTCTQVQCPPLTAPANGALSTTATSYNTVVAFTCNTGYVLNGATSTTCQVGTWSNPVPTCTVGQCSTLTAPANGAISTTATSYNTVVTFTCNPGYVRNGATSTTCQDGTWSNPVPTCTVGQCPSLTAPANGAISTTATSYNTVVTFTCNSGYVRNGATSTTCQDGTWSNPIHTCTPVQCPARAAPANGAVSPTGAVSYPNGVTFTCNPGYTLNGAAAATCRADGSWSNPVPTCRDIDACLANPCVTEATCTDNPAPALDATCTCNTGYTGDGFINGTGCSASGLQCPALLAPTNGILSPTGETSYQTVVTFTCNTGHLLDGASSATCQADGTWSHPVPTCRDINDCSPNPCKNGGNCNDLGNSFQCACAAGYEGDTCQTDINDCSPNPCQHGGTCTDLVNGFQCECLSGYSGDNCESDGTPFGVWTLVGTAVGCLVAGVLLGVAAILLILRCRKTNSKTYDTAEDVYESVRTPGRAASQRSGTGSDAYYSYPMVPRPLPPPLPSQPRGHYQDLRPAVYQGLQKDRGASLPPQNNKGRKEISHNFT